MSVQKGHSESAQRQRQPGQDAGGPAPLDPRRLNIHRVPRRDVPYVPSDEAVVTAMLRFGGVGPSDVVYDLGCGDGRIVIAAAKQCGARGVGVDIDPVRIMECRENAAKARVADRVQFHCQSFFDTDIRPATVVMLYLLPSINVKLRPRLLSDLKPGTRIIGNYFEIGDWEPDMKAEAHHRTLMQWLVPAWVAGRWDCVVDDPRGRHRIVLRLKRHYQIVTGSARVGRDELRVLNGRLFGENLTFKLPDPSNPSHMIRYSCRVDGQKLRGSCQREAIEGPPIPWGGVWRAEEGAKPSRT